MTSFNRMEIGEGIKGLIRNAEKREDLEGGWRSLRDRMEGRKKRERKGKERDVMFGNHLELFEPIFWFPACTVYIQYIQYTLLPLLLTLEPSGFAH